MSEQHETSNPVWVRHIDIFLLALMAILSVVVSAADFLGILDGQSWLATRLPTLTLLVAGVVAGYLAVERRTQLAKLESVSREGFEQLQTAVERSTRTLIDSLHGVELQSFAFGNELLDYVNKRLSQAHDRIFDVSWSSAVGMGAGLNVVQNMNAEYERQMESAARRIPYREVFVFNRPGRKEKLARLLELKLPGYSCAYYDENLAKVPLLQFMVLDDEVIILSDQLPSNLAIRHPHIAKLFALYFDEVWKSATKIRDETGDHREAIQKLFTEASRTTERSESQVSDDGNRERTTTDSLS
jgi:hypothetical protein